ncbi:MAG: carbon monoxide dehydrogenase subunit G [Chloroflexota bacterium]|nr:carbon monoxide dehydrogenase subunit G [Chloroflexota bacterium]
MKVEGAFTIDAERERVWDMLMTPETLAGCIPGCESFEPVDEDTYNIAMRVGVAAVRGNYTGSVTIADKQHRESYRMVVQGRGRGGSVRGEGVLTLSDIDGGTQVSVVGDAQVTGVVARVGQRLMGNASRMLMNQFFNCLKSKIEG